MKASAFLLPVFVLTALYAQEVETQPRLYEATVYLQSAKLYSKGKVNLPSGNVHLVFKGLSPFLVPESIVLRGLGKAQIVNMQFRNDYLVNERDNAKIRQLEEELHRLERTDNRLQARINALNDEIHILKANAKTEKANLAYIQQYITYYKKRYAEIRKEIFELELRRKPLKEQMEKLRKQLEELKGKSKRNAKDLIVYLYVPKGGETEYHLEYLTRNARWQPAYTLRAGKNKSEVEWTYQAEVSQQTGIDWENVRITLSTFRPQYHLRLPEPSPWYLRPHPTPSRRHYKTTVKMEAAAPAQQTAFQQTAIAESEIDVQYTLPTRYDLLSGNEPVLITLQSFTTPARFEYYTVPYLNPKAYIKAFVRDFDNYRILPGKARLYYLDRYTGETRIDPATAHEELTLSFGIDPEIAVKRKMTRNFKDYQSLSGKVIVRREYTIEIKNRKKIPVDIVVKDRVPISQDEKIEVRNIRIEPEGKKDRFGIITWKVHLNPGEKKELKFAFEVKYPKDYRLSF